MALSNVPLALVTGAPRVPLPFGLFSVLAPREGSQDRWENGVTWGTLTCADVGGIGNAYCGADGEPIGLPKDFAGLDAEDGEASPFVIYGRYLCSPIGNTFEFAQDRATAHLLAREEAAVEAALWTGDLGNVPNFAGANGFPALGDAGSFDISEAWAAVSELEQWIATEYGSRGLIHMSRRLASLLTDDGQLHVSGARLLTGLDTPVIASGGYGSDKIVVTPPLFGYRSEIFTSSNRPGDLLDRANNDMYAIAERSYLLGFDPCGAASATITYP